MNASTKENVALRVKKLRQSFADLGLDGMIVPHDDAYKNEIIPASAERLAFISGFTGSSGVAVILKDKAVLSVRGLYALQAKLQADKSIYTCLVQPKEDEIQWLVSQNAPLKIGFDSWLHAIQWATDTHQRLEKMGGALVPLAENPVDKIWTDRPAEPLTPIEDHPLVYAGESRGSKCARLAQTLVEKRCDGFLITQTDNLAWLLNIRGRDVVHTPLALGYAILWKDASVDVFMRLPKVGDSVRNMIGPSVRFHEENSIISFFKNKKGHASIGADFSKTPAAFTLLTGFDLHNMDDPCELAKCCKNQTEVEGSRKAHVRDGVALVKFFSWLSEQEAVDELGVMEKILQFRQEQDLFVEESFTAIAGSGPNGAIIHYSATPETNRRLKAGEFLMLDSGGQYRDATTDVTRTVAIGAVSPVMKDRFTRVLKGHIAIARAIFPAGTVGGQLDVLARQSLWSVGYDYPHGTSHGVGSYLNVHETLVRVSPLMRGAELQVGMILSDEPGYYEEGAYGIRIESLVTVVPSPDVPGMLAFDVLTLCPIDKNAIDIALLTLDEKEWLNEYHTRVYETLHLALTPNERAWLREATLPLT